MLSASMLATMRATVETYTMDQTAEILRSEDMDDGRGGELAGEPEVVATVACEVVRKTPKGELSEAGQVVASVLYEVRLPHGTEIYPTDQLRIGGQLYEILDAGDSHSRTLQALLTCRKVN